MVIFLPNLQMGASPSGTAASATYYVRRRGRMRWQPYLTTLVSLWKL